jgi:hypothetical protein
MKKQLLIGVLITIFLMNIAYADCGGSDCNDFILYCSTNQSNGAFSTCEKGTITILGGSPQVSEGVIEIVSDGIVDFEFVEDHNEDKYCEYSIMYDNSNTILRNELFDSTSSKGVLVRGQTTQTQIPDGNNIHARELNQHYITRFNLSDSVDKTSGHFYWLNETFLGSGSMSISGQIDEIRFQDTSSSDGFFIQNISCWNGTFADKPEGADVTAPVINQVNFTSDGGQICGNATACGPTNDTTPTFRITLDEVVSCRISDTNDDFATMGSSRECSSGQSDDNLTCTVLAEDVLTIKGTDYVYVACQDASSNEATTTITMSMGNNVTSAKEAIETGILNKLPNAIIKTDQQVYMRYVNTTQKQGVFDKVAIYGSQRWFFNYLFGFEEVPGMYSIGTTLNVWENSTAMTHTQIQTAVEGYIDATR